jgi:hypothetical protein
MDVLPNVILCCLALFVIIIIAAIKDAIFPKKTTTCDACGGVISWAAIHCPKCGHPGPRQSII